jgi:serine/threonine protein kinase
MALEIGQLIDDKYRIVRLIGSGGMGDVYEGENVRVRLRVAIKVLQQSLATSEDAIIRFEREAQASGQIGSDHIMVVYDLGVLPNGDRYMVMEYLDGETMAARIRRMGRLDPVDLAPLIHQICLGLSAAHGAGIVHRDLKPDNVFIMREKAGRSDFVKLIDFGISKFHEAAVASRGMDITQAGAVMGTPFYMSPEQARGAQADFRSDLYAVGVIMYEALSGRVPFSATTINELLFQIALAAPTPLETLVPELDARFTSIVARAMAREPDSRFTSAASLGQVVASWENPEFSPSSTQTMAMPVPDVLRTPGRGVPGAKTPSRSSKSPGSGRGSQWPKSARGAVTPGRSNTAESWAQSHLDDELARPRSKTPIVVASLLAVSALGVGAFLFLKASGAGEVAPSVVASGSGAPDPSTAKETQKAAPSPPVEEQPALNIPVPAVVPVPTSAAPDQAPGSTRVTVPEHAAPTPGDVSVHLGGQNGAAVRGPSRPLQAPSSGKPPAPKAPAPKTTPASPPPAATGTTKRNHDFGY